jgi:chromosome segregation ATPase
LLRDRLNELFGALKQLRLVEDNAFESAAKEAFDKIVNILTQVEEAVEKNLGEWAKWFDKLKNLQQDLKTVKLTREGRNELWARIDKAFKEVKDRRFGNSSGGGNQNANNATGGTAETRLQRRIDGLRQAIQKMDNSLGRDEKELDFQQKKLDSSNATQLETQLREVRAKMIQERLNSKKEKLADMNKTLADLEARLGRILAKTATAEDLKVAEEEATDVLDVIEENDNNGEA